MLTGDNRLYLRTGIENSSSPPSNLGYFLVYTDFAGRFGLAFSLGRFDCSRVLPILHLPDANERRYQADHPEHEVDNDGVQ